MLRNPTDQELVDEPSSRLALPTTVSSAIIMTDPAETVVEWKHGFVADYDRLIFDSRMRSYFGPSGYYNVGYWAEGAATPAEAAQALTDRMISALPDDVDLVADIGCGLGATTRRLAELRPQSRVLAVNFSRSQLASCAVRCPSAILVHADAISTGLPSAHLSAILCIEAALHFNTRIAFFHEAFRLLKPGGTLAMTDVLFAERGWPGSWTVPPENFLPGVEAYKAALVSAGFDDIHVEDAFEDCWRAFCRKQKEWADSDPMNATERDQFNEYLKELEAGTSSYLLVSAKKPRRS